MADAVLWIPTKSRKAIAAFVFAVFQAGLVSATMVPPSARSFQACITCAMSAPPVKGGFMTMKS